jgi:hypothetical protein
MKTGGHVRRHRRLSPHSTHWYTETTPTQRACQSVITWKPLKGKSGSAVGILHCNHSARDGTLSSSHPAARLFFVA